MGELIWRNCPEYIDACPDVGESGFQSSAMTFLENGGGNMEISHSDFEKLRAQPAFSETLRDLDISDHDQDFLFETLDADNSDTIDLCELLDGIAKLRGEARRSDIVALSLTLNSVQNELKEHITKTVTAVERQAEVLETFRSSISVRSFASESAPRILTT